MRVISAPATARHDPTHEIDLGRTVTPVWERPDRYDTILDAVHAAGIPVMEAAAHPDTLWRSVHDPDLVDWLSTAWPSWRDAGGPEVLIPDTFAHRSASGSPPTSPIGAAGWWLTDTATPIVEGSFTAAAAAVDAALTAVDLLLDGEEHAVHALTRPPGHHAGRAHVGGFCLVNHAAIAATALRDDLGAVAIVDIDHHHGNGTQELFWEDGEVLYVSLHADTRDAFPWFTGHADETGEQDGLGTTLNLPLPPGTTDNRYLQVLDIALERVGRFDPAAVVVSLGTDTNAADPVGGLGLSPDAYGRIGEAIGALDLPVVSVQEGGYDLDHLGHDTVAVLQGLG